MQLDDGLPSLICNDCAEEIHKTYLFKTQSEKSDLLLRSLLNKTNETEVFVNDIENSSDNDDNNKISNVAEQEQEMKSKLVVHNKSGRTDMILKNALDKLKKKISSFPYSNENDFNINDNESEMSNPIESKIKHKIGANKKPVRVMRPRCRKQAQIANGKYSIYRVDRLLVLIFKYYQVLQVFVAIYVVND